MIEDVLMVAAGMGTRLRAKGGLKPLVELNGKPLISYALEAAFAAGLKRAVVVTGYNSDLLETYLMSASKAFGWTIQTVHNPDFRQPNGLSVLKAKDSLKGGFCLAMCDHVVEPKLYQRLLAAKRLDGETALAIDTRLDNPYVDLDDVTRVQTKGRNITNIGKEISDYNAFDTGIFAADPGLFAAIEQSGKTSGDYSISGGMKRLAGEDKAIGVDIGDSFWIDVDSPDMFALATDWLSP